MNDRYPEHICRDGLPDWGDGSDCPNCDNVKCMGFVSRGVITICQDCGFAIQFRRGASVVNGDYEYWAHFRLPMTPHIARPVRCWSEHDYYAG